METYCGRPTDFSDKIIMGLRQNIKPDDVLIHLGDFCIGDGEKWHRLFNAVTPSNRWLLRGNHDRKSNTWYHNNGWSIIADEITMRLYGVNIILSHRPIERDGDYVNVHGHQHNTGHHDECSMDSRHKLVYMEHNYKPINLRNIIEKPKYLA
jgi:calcineurin-like phosphoesterase family protein